MRSTTPATKLHEAISILDDLRRVVRALRESSREAEQTLGVTGAQLFVLKALEKERALSLNEIAERTRTHQSTVSVVVKRLVEAGMVSRATSPLDARRLELRLTRHGASVLRRSPMAAQERLVQGIERLSPAERKALSKALRALVEAMGL
jgi:DNA-binding MarR family transcriptional regulator